MAVASGGCCRTKEGVGRNCREALVPRRVSTILKHTAFATESRSASAMPAHTATMVMASVCWRTATHLHRWTAGRGQHRSATFAACDPGDTAISEGRGGNRARAAAGPGGFDANHLLERLCQRVRREDPQRNSSAIPSHAARPGHAKPEQGSGANWMKQRRPSALRTRIGIGTYQHIDSDARRGDPWPVRCVAHGGSAVAGSVAQPRASHLWGRLAPSQHRDTWVHQLLDAKAAPARKHSCPSPGGHASAVWPWSRWTAAVSRPARSDGGCGRLRWWQLQGKRHDLPTPLLSSPSSRLSCVYSDP